MMKVELTTYDLAQLVKGIGPGSYDTMELCSAYGKLHCDSWVWNNDALTAATEGELWALYQELKKRLR